MPAQLGSTESSAPKDSTTTTAPSSAVSSVSPVRQGAPHHVQEATSQPRPTAQDTGSSSTTSVLRDPRTLERWADPRGSDQALDLSVMQTLSGHRKVGRMIACNTDEPGNGMTAGGNKRVRRRHGCNSQDPANVTAQARRAEFPGQGLVVTNEDKLFCEPCGKLISLKKETIKTHIGKGNKRALSTRNLHEENLAKFVKKKNNELVNKNIDAPPSMERSELPMGDKPTSTPKVTQQQKATALSHGVGETVRLPGGITSVDHVFRLPLTWGDKEYVTAVDKDVHIEVFARELVLTKHLDKKDRPYLLFLKGGPRFPAPRVARAEGWWGRALKDFRVVMLDQRGTGRSSPITHRTLAEMDSPEEQADFLAKFRADSIVEDCEAVRRKLVGEDAKWTVLGQSFGGFCLLTYLSKHPEALNAGLFTGGLPPVGHTPDQVYRATYRRVAERNRRFYKRYPGDVNKVKKILRTLQERDVELPAGGVLTPGRFLQLGLALGRGGGFESLHYLLENAFDPNDDLSFAFIREVENRQSYDTNPLYAIMHESIYMSGEGVEGASGWSAERVLQEDPMVKEAFDWEGALQEGNSRPAYMVAEMVYRWMFDGPYTCLSGLTGAAEILANRNEWPALYDKRVLEGCEVPCAAAVYYDDIFVEREFSDETSKILPDCKIWVTNRYQHSGLKEDGEKILDTLLGMTRGEVDVPS